MRSLRTIFFLLILFSIAAIAAENPELSSVSLSSPSVVAGEALHGTVMLNEEAPFDVKVSLTADPSRSAKLPNSISIPAGSKSATFTVSTLLSKADVSNRDTVVTIYGNYGVTKSGSFTLLPPASFDQIVDR